MKIIQPTGVIVATTQLGYNENLIFTIGGILIVCTNLYLIPQTSLGFPGGAVVTHFRIDNPLFSHQQFTIYLVIFVWLGVALRNAKIQ